MKQSASELVFKSIRTVMAGQYWVGRECMGDVIERMRERASAPSPDLRRQTFGLTPRELEIISTVISGYGNNEIATKFSLSVKTVKHHLTNIFAKLGVANRLELALFAVHHRLDVTAADARQRIAPSRPCPSLHRSDASDQVRSPPRSSDVSPIPQDLREHRLPPTPLVACTLCSKETCGNHYRHHHWQQRSDPGAPRGRRSRGAFRRQSAAHRGERRRQGHRGAGHSSVQRAQSHAVCDDQLRERAGLAPRTGAVRPRPRQFHRRVPRSRRAARNGAQRDGVPRRSL